MKSFDYNLSSTFPHHSIIFVIEVYDKAYVKAVDTG